MHRKLTALSALLLIAVFSAQAAEKIKIACVGDSITFGAGVEEREKNNYPTVLGKLLGENYETKNFGVSGATLLRKGDLPYWKLNEFKQAGEFAPNIVIIKLGTNDTKPQNMKFKEEFLKDLGDMVDHFAGLPSKPRVILCMPVPVYEAKWGINEKDLKEAVMPAIRKIADEKKLQVIDLYAALSNKPEMFPDKIHPNAAGAALMAQTIAEALKKQ